MKRALTALLLIINMLTLAACATVAGTAVGAGIGSISGDTRTGALVGGSMGLLYDVLD